MPTWSATPPDLKLARPDWPETRHLNSWAGCHGRLDEISPAQFGNGSFARALETLWRLPAPPPPAASGAAKVLAHLISYLRPA